MDTTTCGPPPMTKSTLPPAPPCTTLTIAPLEGHQGARRQSAAALVALEPLPVEEPPGPLVRSRPRGAHRLAMTPGHRPDCRTSATPSSTLSPAAGKHNSPQLPILLPQPATSQRTAASWTPPPNWLMTMDTRRTTRPTAWALHRPAWLLWRPAPPMRCMEWDLGSAALELGSAQGAQLPADRTPDLENTAAPLASPTPRSTLNTPTVDIRKECRLTCETETQLAVSAEQGGVL